MGNTTSKKIDKPSIYIDTCIARDVMEHRKGSKASADILNTIKNNKWLCKTSVFSLMELVDIEQESIFVNLHCFVEKKSLDEVYSNRKQRDLSNKELKQSFDYVEQFTNTYSFIDLVGLTDAGWSLAISVASDSNLHATDVIHLVSAWMEDCDIVVTKDRFFIKEAKRFLEDEEIWDALKVCKPEDCCSALKEMGFTNI